MQPSELEDIKCALGCTRDDEIILTGRDRHHNLPGFFSVVKCKNCGLLRTNPRPTTESISQYYPDDYGPYLGTRVKRKKIKLFSVIIGFVKFFLHRFVRFNTQCVPPMAPGRLLEIGCASGSFLDKMARQGWVVHGIEFSENAAKEACRLGYQVQVGSLEASRISEESFDLIVGWMVLEHLHDPIACLNKLKKAIKPGGWLALSVPNAGSLEFRIFKEKWYALHLPNHLYHFTPKTLESVLDATGWQLVKIYHHRVLINFFASLGYVLQDKGLTRLGKTITRVSERGGVLSYFLYPVSWLFSIFGQTGRMTVWARLKS